MLFNSPAVQNVKNIKSEHQLAAVESRIAELTVKLEKVNTSPLPQQKPLDWTQAYANWNKYEDTEDLQQNKMQEEAKLDGILNKADTLGHYHDHSKERAFFERPENEKFAACEDNRLMGNYLFKEGVYAKAAEHYQIAIAYYEYCFPDDALQQQNLDELRRACLCNISLCYLRLGHLRQAVEAAATVLKETGGRHGKALFRRAQAYRALDEYERALTDLKTALEECPTDAAVIAEMQLVKSLSENYTHNQRGFAQSMLGTAEGEVHSRGQHEHEHEHEHGAAEEGNEETIFNAALPLEPSVPHAVQELMLQCAGLSSSGGVGMKGSVPAAAGLK